MRLARIWSHLRGKRYGEIMWTASGRGFYPLDPHPDDVLIEDIARGLATECRYAGHIALEQPISFYSVAEHSVHVSIACQQIARRECWPTAACQAVALEGLLHDGEEAYLGDMIRPLKYQYAMKNFRRAGALVQRAIEQAFGLAPTKLSRELVTYVDNNILTDEIDQLMRTDPDYKRGKYGRGLGVTVYGWLPDEAQHRFLTRYFELVGLNTGIK